MEIASQIPGRGSCMPLAQGLLLRGKDQELRQCWILLVGLARWRKHLGSVLSSSRGREWTGFLFVCLCFLLLLMVKYHKLQLYWYFSPTRQRSKVFIKLRWGELAQQTFAHCWGPCYFFVTWNTHTHTPIPTHTPPKCSMLTYKKIVKE